jgi:transcriptional regulator of arginine metabolism
MQKVTRLVEIEIIIAEENITSQEELLKRLKKSGIICTQATLSRDLRQLGVIRIPSEKGGYRYSLSDNSKQIAGRGLNKNIISVIKSLIIARGLVLLKTIPGHASSTAFIIDNAGRFEIAGTIAGDDTLLIVPRDNISPSQIYSCLEMIFPGFRETVRKE